MLTHRGANAGFQMAGQLTLVVVGGRATVS